MFFLLIQILNGEFFYLQQLFYSQVLLDLMQLPKQVARLKIQLEISH